MRTITLNGFIQSKPKEYWAGEENCVDGFELSFFKYEELTCAGYSLVCPASITFDVPDNWDPRAGAVKALEEKRKELQAEFQARMSEIERQISQYTALEFAA